MDAKKEPVNMDGKSRKSILLVGSSNARAKNDTAPTVDTMPSVVWVRAAAVFS